jgi:DNA-binding CsgD family transcriptional regulator
MRQTCPRRKTKLPERQLVEREQQLHQLDELLADAVHGHGGVAVLSGLPAAGKTELLQAFTERAAEGGARVLSATASRAEQSLPLAVIGQLINSADLPPEPTEHVSALFDYWSAPARQGSGPPPDPTAAPTLHELCRVLLRIAGESPLVIAIDDVQHTDPSSLQCLSYLARRLRTARILVLLTSGVHLFPTYPVVRADFMRSPYCRSIEVGPLTRRGVELMFDGHPSSPPARLVEEAHAVSGGNPLLVRALIEDLRSFGPAAPERLPVGDAFAEAVTNCLSRCEPEVQQVARVLAVLGESVPPDVLAGLVQLNVETSERAVRLLGRMGLLDEGRFRDGRGRAAVLAETGPKERSALHRQAANALYRHGAPAHAVARHLVRTDPIDEGWAPTVLQEAAAQALNNGETQRACAYLQVAHASCVPPAHRAEIAAMLARTRWRLDPLGVLEYLPELVGAARAGQLSGRDVVRPVHYLAWHGEYGQAVALLNALSSVEEPDADLARHLDQATLQLAYMYPESAADVGGGRSPAALEALATTLSAAGHGELAGEAERVLQTTPLNDDTLGQIAAALYLLIFGDRMRDAPARCDHLLQQAVTQGAPTWQAMLSAVRAEVALRQGDLASAEEHGQRSLQIVAPKGWGVAVGSPLSSLIRVATAAGRYETAAGYLDLPVPATMLKTPFGLMYLHARGTYYLAIRRIRDAIDDFGACGELMTAWGIDAPAFIPWRSDLALAYLALGRGQQARQLVEEQLRRLDGRHSRARGMSLRVLAAGREPAARLPLLREAADLLQASGDRLEVAHSLADLSEAFQQTGESGRARMMLRAARGIATQLEAGALVRRLDRDLAADEDVAADRAPARAVAATVVQSPEITDLSDAERRVATLAALGHTNREIAGKLYVTVSTVEQHLTRVYRKLKVNRRSDLPPGLAAVALLCRQTG